MSDIMVRNIDDHITEALSKEALGKGLSREALVKQILERYVSRMGIPTKGYTAYADNGTQIRLTHIDGDIIGTTRGGPGLSQAQFTAFKKAELMCDPKNGSRWLDARKTLEAAGFEVFEL